MSTSKMDVKKRASKESFFHLFDWGRKPRRKLFANDCGLPEGLELKKSIQNLPVPQLREMDIVVKGASNNESNDYNCGSSMISDEGNGMRALGLVAKLMGLDSLPDSNVCVPCSTSYFNSSPRDIRHEWRVTNFGTGRDAMDFNDLFNEVEGISSSNVKSMPRKIQSRSIERFQMEVLPPKSAKSIPITHNKLLSPIRNPGFVSTRNAAFIMETAAKIIDPGPKTTMKSIVPSFSVPLRIQDLRNKTEDEGDVHRSLRTKESSTLKHLKGHSHTKNSNSGNRSGDKLPCKISGNLSKTSSSSLKGNGKSTSLAVQTKTNVQRRKGPTFSSNESFICQKGKYDVRSTQLPRGQPNLHRSGQKRSSMAKPSNVLKENSQKQNDIPNKHRPTSDNSFSNQQSRKVPSTHGSLGAKKTSNNASLNSKSTSCEVSCALPATGKEPSSSENQKFSQKKHSLNGCSFSDRRVGDDVLARKDGTPIKCNVTVDGASNWAADGKDMDVISFTFTSPLKRSIPGSESCGQNVELWGTTSDDFHREHSLPFSTTSITSPGLNAIGSGSLSALLEEKLRELANKIGSPDCHLNDTDTSQTYTSSLEDWVSTSEPVSTTPREQECKCEVVMPGDKSENQCISDCSSMDGDMEHKAYHMLQGSGELEISGRSNGGEAGARPVCQDFDQISCFDKSSSNGSGEPLDEENSFQNNGREPSSSAQPQDCENLSPADSAHCCTSNGRASTSKIDAQSRNHALIYIREILRNTPDSENFALGQPDPDITSNLFDQLENQFVGGGGRGGGGECAESKLERKLLFDCVGECLEAKCRQFPLGSCPAWARWVQRREWLVEDLYRDISGFRSMEGKMVEEVVEKEIVSTQCGRRWVGFDMGEFEEGVEIEEEIFIYLVDELVADIFF